VVQIDLGPVLLRLQFLGDPLAGEDAELRAPKGFTVFLVTGDFAFSATLFHPVGAAVVGNLDHFINEAVCLYFARKCVLGPEFLMRIISKPGDHG